MASNDIALQDNNSFDSRLEDLGISTKKPFKVKTSGFIMPEWAKGWIALIPALIFLVVFMLYPIINTFIMSFCNNFYWVGNSGSSFVLTNYFAGKLNTRTSVKMSWGFDNYYNVIFGKSGELFRSALINTFWIVIISVPLTIIVGLLIAVALHSIKPLQGFYQTVFFLPYVTNSIALGMVFNAMFSNDPGGFMNIVISVFGISPQKWLGLDASRWSMFFVMVVYSIWNGLAFKILVFMSGLSSIDKQYYDAARIDGANKATIFKRVTVPLLSPQILYITITSFIGACKSYSQIISLIGNGAYDFGGPSQTEWITIVGYIINKLNSTSDGAQGLAAAGCVVLLIIVLIITAIQYLVSKKKVHY